MLISSLKIQKSFLIYLNLNKLSQEQKWLKFNSLVPNVFIVLFNNKNKLFGSFCIVLSSPA